MRTRSTTTLGAVALAGPRRPRGHPGRQRPGGPRRRLGLPRRHPHRPVRQRARHRHGPRHLARRRPCRRRRHRDGQELSFARIGVVVASGTAAQIQAAAAPGVTYVEGNQPIPSLPGDLEHRHPWRRGGRAPSPAPTARRWTARRLASPSSTPGSTRPTPTSGTRRQQRRRREPQDAVRPLVEARRARLQSVAGRTLDTDTLSVGGHGTHVNGIVAGRPGDAVGRHEAAGRRPRRRTSSPSPPARACSSSARTPRSTGCWRTTSPCGAGVPASTCPPIKVTNNSYGPTGGGGVRPELGDGQAPARAGRRRASSPSGPTATTAATARPGCPTRPARTRPPASSRSPRTSTRTPAPATATVSEFSSRGKAGDQSTYPDVSAPGENITRSCRLYLADLRHRARPAQRPGLLDVGTFNTISGTSMAAPHIAGIVAQLFQANPTATPAQIEAALKAPRTSTPTAPRTRRVRSARRRSTRATAWSTSWPRPTPSADPPPDEVGCSGGCPATT